MRSRSISPHVTKLPLLEDSFGIAKGGAPFASVRNRSISPHVTKLPLLEDSFGIAKGGTP